MKKGICGDEGGCFFHIMLTLEFVNWPDSLKNVRYQGIRGYVESEIPSVRYLRYLSCLV